MEREKSLPYEFEDLLADLPSLEDISISSLSYDDVSKILMELKDNNDDEGNRWNVIDEEFAEPEQVVLSLIYCVAELYITCYMQFC